MERVKLFGIAMDNVTMSEAVARIGAWLRGSDRHYVATPNVDHIVRLNRDAQFRAAYQGASLVAADGMPVIWASRLLRRPLKERVTGADLMPAVCALAARTGATVYFLGGAPGVAEQAAKSLQARYPGLRVAGTDAPSFGFESRPSENAQVIARMNAVKPDVVFVCLGAPKQELWIAKHLPLLQTKVALCVGAAVDFSAGHVRRAPHWIRRSGFEWLWRLLCEPKRLWRRYLIDDMAFLGLLIKEMIS